jgi:hypothetical protein
MIAKFIYDFTLMNRMNRIVDLIPFISFINVNLERCSLPRCVPENNAAVFGDVTVGFAVFNTEVYAIVKGHWVA